MKTHFFFVLFCTLFAVACKKKNPDPTPTKANHSLSHSGTVDFGYFSFDTNTVTSQLVTMNQWDALPYKVFSIRTWLKGSFLDVPVPAGEERMTLEFSFLLPYNLSEYDSGCGCLPTPNATRLVNHINSSASAWNDGSERKEVSVMLWNSQFGGGSFNIKNAQIAAQAIGNSIRIYGTIDSLEVGSNNDNRFLTNLVFDYTVPISL